MSISMGVRAMAITRVWIEEVTCPPKTDPVAMLGFGSKTC